MANETIRLDADEVRREARGRWESILSCLATALDPALQRVGKHIDCPFHGGKNDFRLFKDVAETGGAICSCGKWSDGFALLMHANNWTFPETLHEVGAYLGLLDQKERERLAARKADPREQEKVRREREKKDAERKEQDMRLRQNLNRVWEQAVSLADPQAEPVRLYLARRGLGIKNLPSVLRCHPSLPYYEEGEHQGDWPALVALVQGPDGKAVTLHRIYVTDDGYKAPVPSPKKIMAYPSDRQLSGAAIRLGPAGNALGVAEGIETALAIHQSTDIPMWVTISATLLEKVEIPKEVDLLCIWADKDRSGAGERAAKALSGRMWQDGRYAAGLLPPLPIEEDKKGVDWLDFFVRYGPKGIPSLSTIKNLLKEKEAG